MALLLPYRGGQMYELDVRSICHNLLATLARRPEAYHRKVLAGDNGQATGVASIHDRIVFKQPGLDQRVQYDAYLRKSLLDHFYDNEATLTAVVGGQAMRAGRLPRSGRTKPACAAIRTASRCMLVRQGNAWGQPLKITKGVTLEAGGSTL